ncbi:Transposon, En/Spm-like protein [Gossypium australe]|uniref:Transposon, En/Spm-like protein n=1 Tax=Gossypium australe TaxID=47621 RepID=A0A5B6WGH5_9ROSI|nr:Transposon, En/Spm-like protein [Gossypium australe]
MKLNLPVQPLIGECIQLKGNANIKKQVKWFARGPIEETKRYNGYLLNGFRFHTTTREKYLKTRNSGVVVVLFKCDWVDITKGCKKDKFGFTLVKTSHLAHSGTNVIDDPFMLDDIHEG